MLFELSVVGQIGGEKSFFQPVMLQLPSMTARDFSLTRVSCLRLSQAIREFT